MLLTFRYMWQISDNDHNPHTSQNWIPLNPPIQLDVNPSNLYQSDYIQTIFKQSMMGGLTAENVSGITYIHGHGSGYYYLKSLRT